MPFHDVRETEAKIGKGCQILSMMRDFGLVMAPEIVKWRYDHADSSPPRTSEVLQQRVCFAERGVDSAGCTNFCANEGRRDFMRRARPRRPALANFGQRHPAGGRALAPLVLAHRAPDA